METVKDVLCVLNELELTDTVNFNDILEKLRLVKKRLVTEFEDYFLSKLIYALNIVDEINILITISKLDSRLERTDSSRACVFYLNSFKHSVETDKEHEIEN